MSEDRISQAVTRIERALARIETQSALSLSQSDRSDHALAARHEALRTSVAASLDQLDTLIGELEQ